jgi:hypothetical protein
VRKDHKLFTAASDVAALERALVDTEDLSEVKIPGELKIETGKLARRKED